MTITNIRPASYQVASRGVTPTDLATKQPLDATLSALAALNATVGVVEQTGPDVFAKRAIGALSGVSVLTRDDGDARYAGIAIATEVISAREGHASVDQRIDTIENEIIDARDGQASVDARFDLIEGEISGAREGHASIDQRIDIIENEVSNARGGTANLDMRLDALTDGKQNLDPTLTALAGLHPEAGIVEQTAADAFATRAMGVDTADALLRRQDGDGRYITPADADARYYKTSDSNNLQGQISVDAAARIEIERDVASLMSLLFGRPGDAPELYRIDLAGGRPFPIGAPPASPNAVTSYQMRRALASQGKQDEVYYMLGDQDAVPRIQWDSASPVTPGDPLAVNIKATLVYSDAEMDALFTLARTY